MFHMAVSPFIIISYLPNREIKDVEKRPLFLHEEVKKMKLSDSVRYIKGIGEKKAQLFARLGIFTVYDLLYHLPRDMEDRTVIKNVCDLMDGETVCVRVNLLQGIKSFRGGGGIRICQTVFGDGSGMLKVTWFNSPYIAKALQRGEEYVIFGKVTFKTNYFEMINPVLEKDGGKGEKTGKILPVYPLTAGLSQNGIRDAIRTAFENLDEKPAEIIPKEIMQKYGFLPVWEALCKIHFPKSSEDFFDARTRLSFEEMLVMQTGILKAKDVRKAYKTYPVKNVACIKELAESLPFELTSAQKRVINEICSDLKKDVPMNRLVQGDVGSGKTMVAAAAVFAAVKSGFQAAMMAPTEILAKQHFNTFSKIFSAFGIKTVLLTGAQGAKEKRENLEMIKLGEADFVVGTHAIISENVEFKNLVLSITDEQHRFGVRQRAFLSEKGYNVHTLVMTATPIPRTLSLILYGDLDISVIDELPPGRKKIETIAAGEALRGRVYGFIRKNVSEGRQIYIVCPLVEESETLSAKSASEYAENLKKNVFPDLTVGILHGRMKVKEKDEVMGKFSSGEINILVSTTVIEVGVDVPNANIMVIENAERFGLSQLHQLRGRIGRGEFKSYCILFSDSKGEIAKERIKVMCETSDGFKIAEYDLKLRGPGEFFGVRQHGLPELKIANLSCDMELLKTARDAAVEITEKDPELKNNENKELKKLVMNKFELQGGKSVLN